LTRDRGVHGLAQEIGMVGGN